MTDAMRATGSFALPVALDIAGPHLRTLVGADPTPRSIVQRSDARHHVEPVPVSPNRLWSTDGLMPYDPRHSSKGVPPKDGGAWHPAEVSSSTRPGLCGVLPGSMGGVALALSLGHHEVVSSGVSLVQVASGLAVVVGSLWYGWRSRR